MSDCRLILGDCREALPALPSASFDCVITDPPYPCIKREYGVWTEAEWFALMRVVVPECMRLLNPTGSAIFILQPNYERVGRMRVWLWDFLAWVGREFGIVQDAWWWNHAAIPNGGTTTRGILRSSLKACVWLGPPECYRNQDAVLWDESDRQKVLRATERAERRRYPSGNSKDNRRMYAAAVRRGGVTPFNVLPFANTRVGRGGHGAGTPDQLADWWLRYICPPGGSCLDPFSGSGTVPLAALKSGRTAVGVEAMPKYHAIAERRIAEARTAMPLFQESTA